MFETGISSQILASPYAYLIPVKAKKKKENNEWVSRLFTVVPFNLGTNILNHVRFRFKSRDRTRECDILSPQ